MTPQAVTAWIQVAQLLVPIGVNVGTVIHGWITQAHPTATPEETHAVYLAIMQDDTVRAALAAQAAKSDPNAPGT